MGSTERGFTYLGALFLIVLMGAALAGVGELWSIASHRAKERELLWVGTQYAQALRRYYQNSPGVASYPLQLEELLEDRRHPTVHRHLRRLYPDPLTGSTDWGLIRGFENRIVGVYSRSERTPMKTARFPAQWEEFEGADSYEGWQFVADRHFRDGAPAAEPDARTPGSASPRTPVAPRTPAPRPPPLMRR